LAASLINKGLTIRRGILSVVNQALLALAFCCTGLAPAQETSGATRRLEITVLDGSRKPVADALVKVQAVQTVVASVKTDSGGHAIVPRLPPANYSLSVSKAGFESIENTPLNFAEGNVSSVEITLPSKLSHKEEVEVHADSEKLDSGRQGEQLPPSVASELPSRPENVTDVLPLIPGVVRSPLGGLSISGTSENRSALIVNSADVTDPATGQFGTTVPIDSVESINVFQTPFLAEYGRFTSGLVSVETKRGGDKWKWDLNDPFPDFRIRSYQLRGIRDATPRLNFEGPLISGKLYFSEGFEYTVRKVPVLTLPFPDNQQTTQGVNSFSQFDYIVSPNQLLTATFHFAPEQMKSVNLNSFNPESTVPDASIHADTATLADKLTINGGDLFENTLSYTHFTARVWPHGIEDLTITPEGNSGNYFAQQSRSSSRTGYLSTYSVHPIAGWGEHNLKTGIYVAPSSELSDIIERPFNILDSSGRLLQNVNFINGSPVKKTDTETALFGQDHWLISPRLAVDLGVRAESQELTEALRVAPRAGFAWTPFNQLGTVIRGGIGLFYDRVPLSVFGFPQYPNEVVTTYTESGQIAAGPVTYINALGQVDTKAPFVFHSKTPGDFSPSSTNWSFQLEQPVTSALKLRASYTQNQSSGLVILNPIAPTTGDASGSMLLNGSGQSRYRQFEMTARVRLESDRQQLFFSYVNSHARGDLNDFSNYLGSFPTPIVRPNQFGTFPADLPNRFLAWGLVHLPLKTQIAPIFEWRNGFPYLATDPMQAYIGTPYGQRFPHFLSVDARVSKDFKVNPKYSVRLSVTGNNLTNHYNPDSVYANTGAPLYGDFFGQHKRRYMLDFDVLF
jgi:hypothetical protein